MIGFQDLPSESQSQPGTIWLSAERVVYDTALPTVATTTATSVCGGGDSDT